MVVVRSFFFAGVLTFCFFAVGEEAAPPPIIEVGIASVDYVFADNYLRGIGGGTFDEKLERLNLERVGEEVGLVDEDGDGVGTCALLLAASSPGAVVRYLKFPWSRAEEILGGALTRYSVDVLVEYGDGKGSELKTVRNSRPFVFEVKGARQRRMDFKAAKNVDWSSVRVSLTLKGEMAGGGAQSVTLSLSDVGTIMEKHFSRSEE